MVCGDFNSRNTKQLFADLSCGHERSRRVQLMKPAAQTFPPKNKNGGLSLMIPLPNQSPFQLPNAIILSPPSLTVSSFQYFRQLEGLSHELSVSLNELETHYNKSMLRVE
jgi:hypothetical protein